MPQQLRYSLYTADGLTEYAMHPAAGRRAPYHATWQQEPVDEAIDGSQTYGLYKAVVWDFTPYDERPGSPGIPLAQYDLFALLRQSTGLIRLRTWRQTDRTYVVCTGRIDKLVAATIDEGRQRAYGVRVEFTRVVEV